MYLLELQVPLAPFCTFCPFRYPVDLQVPLGPLGISWTLQCFLDFQKPLEPLGTHWTFMSLLDLLLPLGPLGTCWGLMYLLELTRTRWYRQGLMVLTTPIVVTQTHGIIMLLERTHGKVMDSWYRHSLIVLKTPKELPQTHCIELVLLNHIVQEGRVLPVCGIIFQCYSVSQSLLKYLLAKFLKIHIYIYRQL